MTDSNGPTDGNAGEPASKADKLAAEALDAGRSFVATDTGRKVAEATDAAFEKAEALGRKALDSDIGRKAMDSDIGRQAGDFVQQVADSTKKAIPNELGRNMAVGAAAGAVLAVPIPFIGSLFGALVGAGLGYLRTVTKKS